MKSWDEVIWLDDNLIFKDGNHCTVFMLGWVYMYYRLSFYLPWGGLSSIMMGDHKNLSHGSNTKCGHVALIWRWYGRGNQLQAYTKNKTDTGQPNKHWATELKKYIFYLIYIKLPNNKVSQIQKRSCINEVDPTARINSLHTAIT